MDYSWGCLSDEVMRVRNTETGVQCCNGHKNHPRDPLGITGQDCMWSKSVRQLVEWDLSFMHLRGWRPWLFGKHSCSPFKSAPSYRHDKGQRARSETGHRGCTARAGRSPSRTSAAISRAASPGVRGGLGLRALGVRAQREGAQRPAFDVGTITFLQMSASGESLSFLSSSHFGGPNIQPSLSHAECKAVAQFHASYYFNPGIQFPLRDV
ncbi:hypothetical protein EYF80_053933 [Liparis tanakae]|uniref:Uncharacterized protein n=1 Tax=Liparis tanakae TaxID=230148 RepID=A0A4Z2F574_9TELE|nr:hypothetical protein EYF80_053933 [Liparis tanakae]